MERISEQVEHNTIVFSTDNGSKEMLSIKKDGFYVRGVRVEQDEHEARKVYDTFVEWMKTTKMI